MEGQKILIVEDDADISGLLVKIMEGAGYQVRQAFSGTEALFCMERELPDCVLLDLMLPGMTGEAVLDQIRQKQKKEMPVLILSAKVSVQDKVKLLRLGADDYITKPFSLKLVLMRIEAVLRRTKEKVENHNIFISHGIKLDTNRHTVEVNGKEINLTQLEFDILEVFMKHRNQVLTRDNLINQVWGYDFTGDEKAVNIHVMNLRRKLDIDCIQTVRGVGYKFESED